MEKKDTKSHIIAVGTDMISLQGYNATGLDAILKKAGVPKGSFYHYFGSKEEFGLAVIDNFNERYERRLDTHLAAEGVAPLDRIRNYLESGLARLTQNQCTRGCLVGNLGQELADQNERFRERLDEIFLSWRNKLAACLQEAQRSGDLTGNLNPDTIAGFILSGWEGALLRAKVMKSPQPMQDFIDTIFATVLRRD